MPKKIDGYTSKSDVTENKINELYVKVDSAKADISTCQLDLVTTNTVIELSKREIELKMTFEINEVKEELDRMRTVLFVSYCIIAGLFGIVFSVLLS